ncbi:hypothetical protein O181_133480 [Austropuccinia psidii MF-1]|uniref:Uncharacterized protein n=1 Tax=Austropuccinia psidii MF-1 TaxID=1389203 RepID=A0A9Q3QDK4_9BASI|nr:hypothetical protein [Austropuccinia psidii MF-1]
MVHKRNGSNYSVQTAGSGPGRGKNRTRSGRPSSRKAHLEDARVSYHFPRCAPTTFEIKSEPEMIQGNVSKVEPLQSGRHVNISVPVQRMVQSRQGRGMSIFSKPFSGGNELLLAHQELSGSGEYHGAPRRMESLVIQRKSPKDKKLFKEPNYCIHRPKEGAENYPSFGEGRTSSKKKLQISSRTVQRQAQRTLEETETSQEK